jgi:hypothetical protein
MALQGSGAISLGDIATEFGGTVPHAMDEYYGVAAGIPTSGALSLDDFYGATATASLTFLGTDESTGYTVDGPAVMVVSGDRVGTTAWPTLTTCTIDGSNELSNVTTLELGGNDNRLGTETKHRVAIYAIFAIPAGQHTVVCGSDNASCYQYLITNGSMSNYSTATGLTTQDITVPAGYALITAASGEKNQTLGAPNSPMVVDYYSTAASSCLAHLGVSDVEQTGHIRTTSYAGRGGYVLIGN